MSIKSKKRQQNRQRENNSILNKTEKPLEQKKDSFFSFPICPNCKMHTKYCDIFLAMPKAKYKCKKCGEVYQYKTTKYSYFLICIIVLISIIFNIFVLNYATNLIIIAIPTIIFAITLCVLFPLTLVLKKKGDYKNGKK